MNSVMDQTGFHLIRDHVENGLVVFCGAGVSAVAPTCLPSWWEMNEHVVKALTRQLAPFCGEEKAGDFASQINSRRDNRRFPPEFQAEIISKHYGESYFKILQCLDGDEPNLVHLAIVALAKSGHVRAVVTSNFDCLLEVAFKNLAVPFERYFNSGDFERLAREYERPSQGQKPCRLLKLHGSINDHTTLVDTLAQRMRGLSPAICDCLRHLLRNHHWLFLGYSGADLEANPHYLCLQSEAGRAVGFSWLVRESAENEPIQAVKDICGFYGERAHTPRGELPGWLFEQLGPFIAADLPLTPSFISPDELDRRKEDAKKTIIDHTREWSESLGNVRAAMIIADILENVVGNPQEACELLKRALDTLGDDDSAYIAVANSLANIVTNLGDLDAAMLLAEKALAKNGNVNEKGRAGLLITMGLIEHKRGQYSQALARFEQVYEIKGRLKDEHGKSIALHNQAMALSSLGEYSRANSCYEKELEIVRKAGDVVAQAKILNNIGELLRNSGQYDEAIDVLKQGIKLRQRLGDDLGVGHSLGNIASVHNMLGKYKKAKAAFEHVLAIFQRYGNRIGEITTIFNLGDIAQKRSDLEKAERLYQHGIMLAEKCGMIPEHAKGLWQMASLYRMTGRDQDAMRLYDKARSMYQGCGDLPGEADVLNEIGILFWKTGELDAAGETFKEVIALRKHMNQPADLCTAIGNLALVYKDLGNLDQALALLREKLSLAERLKAKDLIIHAHYNIGVVYHQKNDIDKALESFEAAQRLCLEIGLTDRGIEILGIMGQICGFGGRIGVSLQWFDRAIQLAETVGQRTSISHNLLSVLDFLLKNGFREIAEEYVQRCRAVGAYVEIEKA